MTEPKPLSCQLGATREDWVWAARFIGEDILPAVTDNTRPRAPRSELTVESHPECNKTPSRYTANGEIMGVGKWAQHRATPNQIRAWALEPYLNILMITRRIQAIDIDVPNKDLAERIQAQVLQALGFDKLPLRYRESTGKRTILVEITGEPDLRKRVIVLPDEKGKIEFLATGNQTVVFGAHPEGERYIVVNHEDGFPKVDFALAEVMWDTLRAAYHPDAKALRTTASEQRTRHVLQGHVAAKDPVVPFLYENGHVIEEADHKLYVTCPWADMHTTRTSDSSTAWLCVGYQGAPTGSFKCMHESCQPKDGQNPTLRYLQHIGYYEHNAQQTFQGEEQTAPPPPTLVQSIEHAVTMQSTAQVQSIGFMRDNKGNLEKRISNLNEILRVSPDVFQFKFDDFTQMTYGRIGSSTIYQEVNDITITTVQEIIERRFRLSFSPMDISRSIDFAADAFKYDSAQQWLAQAKAKWDGQPRIAHFARDILKALDSPYATQLSCYLWTALAGRLLNPGVKADISPILISQIQGTGKSSLVQALTPFNEWYTSLDLSAQDDDLYRLLQGKSSVELPELKGLSTRDADSLKAFLTQPTDAWVPKYKEKKITVPRRCIFVGTDNRLRMLTDPTGNRRWAPIRVAATSQFVDWPKFESERDHYWAEAAHALDKERSVLSGIEYHASRLRLLAAPYIADATVVDPWYRQARQWVEQQPFGSPITIQALAGALQLDPKLQSQSDVRRLRTVAVTLHLQEMDSDVWMAPGMHL